MLIREELYSLDTSDKARAQIAKINLLRSQLITRRYWVSKRMAYGYLHYHGLTKAKFDWRFSALYDEVGNMVEGDDVDAVIQKTRKCKHLSAEQLYKTEYNTYNIVQEKIDEMYNNLSSRKMSVSVDSLPYQQDRHLFGYLLQQQFESPQFRLELEKAELNAAKKGVGFLRPIIWDKQIKQRIRSFDRSKKNIEGREVEKEVDWRTGLKIESVDPETVFVDPYTSDPQHGFIITPYEPHELINRFPKLKKYIREYYDTIPEDEEIDNLVQPEAVYNHHIGEYIHEMYEHNDLSLYEDTLLFSNSGILEVPPTGTYGSTLFSDGCCGPVWEQLIGWTMSEERRNRKYFVTEYYNIAEDIYMVYIGNVLLHKGSIIEPFKSWPLCPIYMDNQVDGHYYGKPLSEYFIKTQQKFDEADNQQSISSLVTGKQMLGVMDDMINEEYHPGRQFTIERHAPVNVIHLLDNDTDTNPGRGQVPVFPVNINNGADTVLQNRKNETLSLLERRFPSTKVMQAGLPEEARTEIMYDRDLFLNKVLSRLAGSLSEFAYKVFSCILFELEYFRDKERPIPLPFASGLSGQIVVAPTEEDLVARKRKHESDLKRIYEEDIQKAIEQLGSNQQVVQSIMKPLQDEIQNAVITQYAGPELEGAQSEEERNLILEATMQTEAVRSTIAQTVQEEGAVLIRQKLEEIARGQVPPPKDTNIYLSLDYLSNVLRMQKDIVFRFDKSKLERQRDMLNLINTLKPLEQFTPFLLDLTQFMIEALLAQDMNPDLMLRPKPPSAEMMIRANQTRLNYFAGLDKFERIFADHFNENLGQPRYSFEQMMQDLETKLAIQTQMKIGEVNARAQARASTDIIKNEAQVKNQALMQEREQEGQMQGIDMFNSSGGIIDQTAATRNSAINGADEFGREGGVPNFLINQGMS